MRAGNTGHFRTLAAGCICITAAGLTARAQAPRSLNDLTGPWQLLVDDYPVESKTGLARVYHPFTKYAANPVLVASKTWEGNHIYLYGSVLPNESGGGYRMWYHALSNDTDRSHLLYATSSDGISWTKPNLGIINYNGSTNNNFFIRRGGGDHILSVIHTPWETDPNRRYKLINFDSATARFLGAWSADGLHWTDVPANPILPPASDVGNFAWDPFTGRYLGYLKMAAYVREMRRRAVGFTSTTDFNSSWPALQLILAPDDFDDRWAIEPQRTHFYGLCAFPYESMYLGFLWVFRATDIPDGYNEGPIFVELVTSHDGVQWQREEGDRPPILPLGPAGSWDDGMVFTTQHPLVEGGTIKLWYGGSSGTHASFTKEHTSIGLATLRKDGFASLDADTAGGTLTTRKLLNATGPLRVNYRANGGSIRVEVLDGHGNVVPGYAQSDCQPLTSDSTDATVAWNAHSELPADVSTIRLRFVLQNASLYSFRAANPIGVVNPPTITQQPAGQRVVADGTAAFTVAATCEMPITWQWFRDGVPLASDGHYAGTNTPTLTVGPVSVSDLGPYQCRISNSTSETWSNPVRLTIQGYCDFDLDGDIDIEDFGLLQTCFSGNGVRQEDPACLPTLLDEDNDVDPADLSIFRQCLTGANVPISLSCMP